MRDELHKRTQPIKDRKGFWWVRFWTWPQIICDCAMEIQQLHADLSAVREQFRKEQDRVKQLQRLAEESREMASSVTDKADTAIATAKVLSADLCGTRQELSDCKLLAESLDLKARKSELESAQLRAELAATKADLSRATLEAKQESTEHQETRRIVLLLRQHIHATQRLDIPPRDGIRGLFSGAKRLMAVLVILFPIFCFGGPAFPPPILRGPYTTNVASWASTNLFSLSTSNSISKPLTNYYKDGVGIWYGIEQGSNIVLFVNGSNIVVNGTGTGTGSSITTNANQFGVSPDLTIKDGAFQTNMNFWGDGTNHANLWLDGDIFPSVDNARLLGDIGKAWFAVNVKGFGVRFMETGPGTEFITLSAPVSIAGGNSYPITLPDAQGANGTILTNDGAGNLGWWIPPFSGVVTFGDLLWTNDAGKIHLTTNVIKIGFVDTNDFIYSNPADDNFGIGYLIGTKFTLGGVSCTFVGSHAGTENTSGGYNSGLGFNVLNLNTTGSENSAFGANVLEMLLSGNENSGFGRTALAVLSAADDNTALGSGAMKTLVDGSFNTAGGREALSFLQHGRDNAAFGWRAGHFSRTNYGTFLGSGADFLTFPGIFTNVTAIGWNAKVDADNTMQLGNALVESVITSGKFISTNGVITSLLQITNSPGLDRQLMFWNTNGLGYTAFSGPTNAWLPTNRFFLTITNPVAGQVLKILNVSFANGVASIVLTNDTDNSGAGDAGGTNARQFGTLTLTNLSGNPIPFTNIIVADTGIALGTNAGITYITNTMNTNAFQPASAVLSNLVGTVASNVTNFVSLSTTNGTSKPLTNSYTSGVLTMFGIEQGSGVALTMSSNIVIGLDWTKAASITNVNGVSNWVNAVSNYVTAATNSASVTNWINFRQPADAVLSNLVGTVARNVTNVVSLSTTNATSKPLTNSYTSGVLTIFGIEQGSGHSITMNASNIVSGNDWLQTASITNVNGVSNWVNAVSNYVTSATNSASVTNWINFRQPASTTLSNLSGTGAVTNLFAPSLSNATIKPVVFGGVGNAAGMTNTTGQIYGLEAGANITLTPNGSNIVIVGVPGVAGDSLWSSNNITIFPSYYTNRVAIGTNEIPNTPGFYVLGYNQAFPGAQNFEDFAQGSGEAYGLSVMLKPDSYTGNFSAGIQSRNDVENHGGNFDVLTGGNASYGIDCINTAAGSGSKIVGATCGIQGYAISVNSINVGVSGIAGPSVATSTNVALAGVGIRSAGLANTKDVGLYVGMKTGSELATPATIATTALQINDSWTSNVPLMIWQTNNGNRVAWVDASGKITTTNELLVKGTTQLTGLTNNGDFTNTGIFTNGGAVTIGGSVTNYVDFRVVGTTDHSGSVTNAGRMDSAGGVTNWIQMETKGTLYASSNLLVKAGQSVSNAWVGGTMVWDLANYTNLNANIATFSNLARCTIPAHALTNNGDMIRAYWGGVSATAMVNTQDFKIVYGSTTILDTGNQIASNYLYRAFIEITRTGNNAQHVDAKFEWLPNLRGDTGVPWSSTNVMKETLVETNGINTTLAIQASARRLGAVTNTQFRVYYDPAVR